MKLDYKRRGLLFLGGGWGHFEMGSRIRAMEKFSLWFRTCLSLYLLCIRCKKYSHLMNKRSECIRVWTSVISSLRPVKPNKLEELCGHQMLTSIIHANFSFVMHHCISVSLHHAQSWPPRSALVSWEDALLNQPWRLEGLLSDCSLYNQLLNCTGG